MDIISYQKAKKAEQLAKEIVNGEVDLGVLRTNIDQKLNDLETQYAPELTSLGEQLAQTQTRSDERTFYESLVNKKKRKPMVTWIDDDARKGFYTKLKLLAEEYGVVFTSAVITGRQHGFPGDDRPYDDYYMHYDEMMEMQNKGLAEFVSHTDLHDTNHRLTDMTEEELHEDFSKSKRMLRDLGFKSYDATVVYPFGSENELVREVARQYFSSGVDTVLGNYPVGVALNPLFDQYKIGRINIQQDLNEVLTQIDDGIANNKWIILMSHVDDSSTPFTEELGRTIIEHVLNQGVDIVGFSEGLKQHGHLAQFNNTKITNDGSVHSDVLGTVKFDDDLNPDTPISDFDHGVTYSRILQTLAGETNTPEGNAGTLVTHKPYGTNTNTWFWQDFQTNRAYGSSFFRRTFNSAGTPSSWYQIDKSEFTRSVQGMTQLTTDTPIEDFDQGITYSRISNSEAQAIGAPENRGGMLVTYKPFDSTDNSWFWQDYIIYGGYSQESYRRKFASDGTPYSWRKISIESV